MTFPEERGPYKIDPFAHMVDDGSEEEFPLTEREKIKTEEDRINFIANLYEAINYTCMPKREKALINRLKFNFYKKHGIKLGCKDDH